MRIKHKPIPELTDRQLKNFHAKINVSGPDDCWEWTAWKDDDGYGHFGLPPYRTFIATRIMYFLHHGVDPGELCVCHTCDNPSCCNPKHLFLGTKADNVADMIKKGRGRPSYVKGVGHGRALLTESDVLAIRNSGELHRVLAAKYGVNDGTVSRIKSRKSWKHI